MSINGKEFTEEFTDVTANEFYVPANGDNNVFHRIETLTDRIYIMETEDRRVLRVQSHYQEHPIGALAGVHAEMQRQVAKWGQQNHPSYTGNTIINEFDTSAQAAKDRCDEKAKRGDVSWTDIFLEEVMEAVEEAQNGDLEKLRTELVQCAAVAVSWAESIDRNNK
ncbi:hypothetical protein D3C75_648990 [compost metagenome]